MLAERGRRFAELDELLRVWHDPMTYFWLRGD
jgi:hypothetical protein